MNRTRLSHILARSMPIVTAALVAALVLMHPHAAFASTATTSSGSLPWEGGLSILSDSITGPVAFAISLLGIVVCGAMLIWGGEINEFTRRAVMLVLVIAVIVLAKNVLTDLFSSAEVVASMTTTRLYS